IDDAELVELKPVAGWVQEEWWESHLAEWHEPRPGIDHVETILIPVTNCGQGGMLEADDNALMVLGPAQLLPTDIRESVYEWLYCEAERRIALRGPRGRGG